MALRSGCAARGADRRLLLRHGAAHSGLRAPSSRHNTTASASVGRGSMLNWGVTFIAFAGSSRGAAQRALLCRPTQRAVPRPPGSRWHAGWRESGVRSGRRKDGWRQRTCGSAHRAAEQADAADKGRLEQGRGMVVGAFCGSAGIVSGPSRSRPSQLIRSVLRTLRGSERIEVGIVWHGGGAWAGAHKLRRRPRVMPRWERHVEDRVGVGRVMPLARLDGSRVMPGAPARVVLGRAV